MSSSSSRPCLALGLQALPDLVELRLHHALGRGEAGPVGQRVQQLPLQPQPRQLVVFVLELLGERLAQLGQVLEPELLRQSSSIAGTTACFSFLAVISKLAALPARSGTPYSVGKVTSMVRVSPGFMPSSCSVKPGMNPLAADLDVDVGAGAARERGAVDPADEIDGQHLALGCAAVAQFLRRDLHQLAVALGDVGQRLVHRLRRRLGLQAGQA